MERVWGWKKEDEKKEKEGEGFGKKRDGLGGRCPLYFSLR